MHGSKTCPLCWPKGWQQFQIRCPLSERRSTRVLISRSPDCLEFQTPNGIPVAKYILDSRQDEMRDDMRDEIMATLSVVTQGSPQLLHTAAVASTRRTPQLGKESPGAL